MSIPLNSETPGELQSMGGYSWSIADQWKLGAKGTHFWYVNEQVKGSATHSFEAAVELSPDKGETVIPVAITMLPTGPVSERPQFGPKLAELLNGSRWGHAQPWDQPFLEEVKPTDHRCMRSESMINSLLADVALDQYNGPPDSALEPITTAGMKAFAFPGGLFGATDPNAVSVSAKVIGGIILTKLVSFRDTNFVIR